ncbi:MULTISPECIES: methyltransferase domain-containing protein [unclassified Thalassospira]|uniref:methyltransferase domain-containing protein n=1 Tax=unclassified Thalassospira TaxID=2648997 RepID=UPI000EE979A1|nr:MULTISPECIES: methyltransferase domain-containing protein [unclassified Thalassospira]HAI30114.1 trans-aconitate methyltransferase [Thalassospira sp.]|tara:strand:+ start:1493 stop:2299 length:807 start_codon:yes stop_codon:yes gene_type:complete
MSNTHWDPARYGLFGNERLRPAIDLISRLPKPANGFSPRSIVDLGCGPGSVTAVLADAYGAGRADGPSIVGVDSSDEMLETARKREEDITWQKADIADWQPDEPVDLLFSNAALHWVPDHSKLFPRLLEHLRPGGMIAIQVPNNFLAPSHQLIGEAGMDWRKEVATAMHAARIMRPGDYFDALAPSCDDIDLWQTQYCHVLTGPDAVYNWTSSTILRPVMDALPDDEAREKFTKKYKERLNQVYPSRDDGRTLFPFNRLFMIAQKKSG